MDVSVTYNAFEIESLGAVAAACSRNVLLYEVSKEKGSLSMGPSCESIKSRNSIIFFILNFNPLEQCNYENVLWHEKYVKPILYRFYKQSCGKTKDKSQILAVQKILNIINTKFGSILQPKLKPLELIIWGDLYLILRDNSSYKFEIPESISKWFSEINSLESTRKALNLILGNAQDLNESIKNLVVPEIFEDLIDNFVNLDINDLPDNSKNDMNIELEFIAGLEHVNYPPEFTSPRLPVKGARNILITSALPYVNNVPHLGNLIGSTLSADVFNRYCRLRGYNSIYVCGTDEYGTTTEVKASEERSTPREICDKYHAIHADVYSWFGIDFDVFGRTSSPEHTTIVQEVFHDIHSRGFILEDSVTQLYCVGCKKFLADRLVEGQCPLCKYEDARGDQCDHCGKLINAIDLRNPRCKLCNGSPESRTSNHLFLDLHKIQSKLDSYLQERMGSPECVWSTNAKAITNSWLKEGLKPRCITRDLTWGVPVPLGGFESKVFYVWFDAVLGYISITSRYTPDWRQWWMQSDSCRVELYQFMGKDNVPFHSVIFPANLMGTGKSWNMLEQLVSTEYLNYENTKFSKSRGVGVFGTDARATGIDRDVWRFYLVSCRPESQDASFSWDEFATRVNSELLGNLGNFINRALSFVSRFFDGVIPDFVSGLRGDGNSDAGDLQQHRALLTEVSQAIRAYCTSFDQLRMRDALGFVLKISALGNAYIQHHQPWVLVKTDATRARAGTTIGVAANLAALLGVLLAPIMPSTSDRILEQCAAVDARIRLVQDDCRFRACLQPGHRIGTVAPLFQRMEPELINAMKLKHSSGSGSVA